MFIKGQQSVSIFVAHTNTGKYGNASGLGSIEDNIVLPMKHLKRGVCLFAYFHVDCMMITSEYFSDLETALRDLHVLLKNQS